LVTFDGHQHGTAVPEGGHPPHQIQALDRTQPGLPLKPGKCGTMTHDYRRHGTTTLFAAFNVLVGVVLGRCMQKHTHQEFIRYPKVQAWLIRHPRWTFHFTPTSSSWLNAVENFFSTLTRKRLRRGVFRSIVDLQAAINRLRNQPTSALSLWFHERVRRLGGRMRKTTIVALARKLLIALWRYTTAGVVIEGAVMKAALATI
jgi:transposase